jgi:hypothetical protein
MINIIKNWKMRPRANRPRATRAAVNGFGMMTRLDFSPSGGVIGCDGSRANSAFNDERHTFSLKIRPKLHVFFIADPADFF